jgi:energy-coupling factor transporter ATP-binding protein EcfA2
VNASAVPPTVLSLMGSTEFPNMYARGAEWRRWDLHVHTPYSVLNNGFGADFKQYAKVLFERAVQREIAVIGVTDYFTVRGFRELSEIQQDESLLIELLGEDKAVAAREITLLANVELRLSDVIKVGDHEPRVNLHVLFAEDLSPDEIEGQFLHRLEFLSESAPDVLDEQLPLTEQHLAALGKRLKEEEAGFQGESDLRIGMEQAVVSHQDVTEALSRAKPLSKRHLMVLAADDPLSKINWAGQGHLSRKAPIQKAHMLFSANPNTRSFGLGEKHDSPEEFIREFKSFKPCIHGSDAHRPEDLFVCAEDRQLWIRADPTFNGLSQLLLAPDRVYVGPEPPALARQREVASKVLEDVQFEPVGDPDSSAQWFSGSLPLNPGLVAVIGKKGSGKSALAEAIALAGNTRNDEYFSFLSSDRFLSRPNNLGDRFSVEINWRSGSPIRKLLSDSTDSSLPERVRYVPQHYLEKVCTEIGDASVRTLFDEELEAVIFSHVPDADRLGKESLRALIDHKSAAIDGRISQLRARLAELNRDYFALRLRGSKAQRQAVVAQLSEKKAELEAHQMAKPAEVLKPTVSDQSDPTTADSLAGVVAKIEALDVELADLRKREEDEKKRLAAIDRILGRIENLRAAVETFYDNSAPDFEASGFDARSVVSLSEDRGPLDKAKIETVRQIEQLSDDLDRDRSGSKAHARVEASLEAERLRKLLDEPQRRYQEYERAIAQWQRRGEELQGSGDKPDSVKGLESKLAALDDVPAELAAVAATRDGLTGQIFAAKQDLLEEYQKLYGPVQRLIDERPIADEVTSLSFSAENVLDGLADGLLGMIHRGRRGSFQGDPEGRERLEGMIADHDFSSAAGLAAFLEQLTSALTHDVRREESPEVGIADQLVNAATPEALYDFIFGLEYMRPRFELRWGGKPLHQLSPGERGTLLLIFYLLIDPDNAPLVIDQPEENLDNETITQLLVPAIKHAKSRRQIIMITHNPNLAVVCDADQVIHASIDKVHGNAISYAAGAIEDPRVNQAIINVLEGTKPAFDLRDAKYDVLDRAAA